MGIAGEVGHMGINYNAKRFQNESMGTFEYCAGTEGAARYMMERMYEFPGSILNENSTYMDIVEAYEKGDPLAVYAIEKMDSFVEKVKQAIMQFVHPSVGETIVIRYSCLNEDSFLLGGYYYILESLYKENLILERIRQAMD